MGFAVFLATDPRCLMFRLEVASVFDLVPAIWTVSDILCAQIAFRNLWSFNYSEHRDKEKQLRKCERSEKSDFHGERVHIMQTAKRILLLYPVGMI